jgi:ribosomal protein S1
VYQPIQLIYLIQCVSPSDPRLLIQPQNPHHLLHQEAKLQFRLSLSIKKTEPDPWWDVQENYPAGKRISVKVVRFSNFGAFVQVAKGLEGLIHVSNMGRKSVNRPQDAMQIGTTVLAEVLDSDEGARKMGLRLLDEEPEED